MNYYPSDIIAITVRRYLKSPNDNKFWKEYQNLPERHVPRVLNLIVKYFDYREFNRHPLLKNDNLISEYLEKIKNVNSEFPQDELILEYQKHYFTPDDNDFFNRVILENKISDLEKQIQNLENSRLEESIVSKNLAYRDYKLISILGSGGFGKVFLAKHLISNELFAIKCLRNQDKHAQQDILREITHLAKINDPHIIKYFNSFYDDKELLYMVMEYCPSGSIADRIREKGKIQIEELTKMFLSLTRAFYVLHRNNIVHHDIKPSNILIDKNNELKISDFGCVNTNIGTIIYQDPFRGNDDPNEQTDIFSLGVTLLECAIGYNPFIEIQESERLRMLNSADLPVGNLPLWLKEIVLKAVQINPELRFPTMEEFHQAFLSKNIPKLLNRDLMKLEKDALSLKNLINRKRWIKAGSFIEKHPHINRNLNLLIYSGQYFLSINKIEKAKEQFQKALKINPNTRVEKQIAEIYLQTGEISKATSLLSSFLNRNFTDIEAHNQMLHAYFLSDRLDLGYDQALILHESFPNELIFENNLLVFDSLIHEFPEKIISLKKKNPFTVYNYNVITNNHPESWKRDEKPLLKTKLIFQEYRFQGIENSKNTLIVTINNKEYEVIDPIISFGRNGYNYNTFHDFDSNNVSRRHFVIVNSIDNVWLYDLDSTGVYVDGKPVVKKCFLMGLHQIRFGNQEISIKTSKEILM